MRIWFSSKRHKRISRALRWCHTDEKDWSRSRIVTIESINIQLRLWTKLIFVNSLDWDYFVLVIILIKVFYFQKVFGKKESVKLVGFEKFIINKKIVAKIFVSKEFGRWWVLLLNIPWYHTCMFGSALQSFAQNLYFTEESLIRLNGIGKIISSICNFLMWSFSR